MKNKEYSYASNWNCIIISVVLFVILTLLVIYMPDVVETDSSILTTVQKFFTPYPEFIPFILNEIYRDCFVWPLIVSAGVLISHKMYLKTFLLVFFSQLSFVTVHIVCRERPCGNLHPGYSFPSTHSLAATCFFGILIYLTVRHTSGFWKYFLVALFSLIIILMGISRLWLGVHYPIDVIAGYLMGIALVNLYIILCKAFNV